LLGSHLKNAHLHLASLSYSCATSRRTYWGDHQPSAFELRTVARRVPDTESIANHVMGVARGARGRYIT
jgi:hypothetical protein